MIASLDSCIDAAKLVAEDLIKEESIMCHIFFSQNRLALIRNTTRDN